MPHKLRNLPSAINRFTAAATDPYAKAASQQTLVDELEAVIANRNIGSRAKVLQRVADLFMSGSNCFDGEQQALFDDIMCRLVDEVDTSARIALGQRLAAVVNAPNKVCCALALDESIEVAGPLLAHSDRLDDETLIVGATTKSQQHLLAISKRKVLSEEVTDILVERGNQEVVSSTAANYGAQFSECGYSTLITRAGGDDGLAVTVWLRADISREQLLTLFSIASDTLRLKLKAANRGKADLIKDMVNQASDQIQKQTRERSPGFGAAKARVKRLHRDGELSEGSLRGFAETGQFDETAVALSLLLELPIGAIERILVHDRSEQVLIVAKSIGLSWNTTRAILSLKTKATAGPDYGSSLAAFEKLKPETARTALQYFRLRQRAFMGSPN